MRLKGLPAKSIEEVLPSRPFFVLVTDTFTRSQKVGKKTCYDVIKITFSGLSLRMNRHDSFSDVRLCVMTILWMSSLRHRNKLHLYTLCDLVSVSVARTKNGRFGRASTMRLAGKKLKCQVHSPSRGVVDPFALIVTLTKVTGWGSSTNLFATCTILDCCKSFLESFSLS